MKKLLLILGLILFPSIASAQCTGVFPDSYVCGNATGTNNTPRPTPSTSFPSPPFQAPYIGSVSRTLQDKAADYPTVKDFGAKCDGRTVAANTIAITAADTTLTVVMAVGTPFTPSDVGKNIIIPGAGAAGVNLRTTIATYISGTQVTIALPAVTTVAAIQSSLLIWTTDDTAAITTAGRSGIVTIPYGICVANSGSIVWNYLTPVSSGIPTAINGQGINVSAVAFIGCAGDGFLLQPSNNNATLTISNVSILTTCANAAAGAGLRLEMAGPFYTQRVIPWLNIANVYIGSVNVTTQGWAVGLQMQDVNGAQISNFNFTGYGLQSGAMTQSGLKSLRGIWHTGSIVPTDVHMTNIQINNAINCFEHSNGVTEGVYITSYTFLNCQKGLYFNPNNDGVAHPLLVLSGGHVNAFEYPIYVDRFSDVFIDKSLLYCATGGSQACTNIYFPGNTYNINLDGVRTECYSSFGPCDAGIRIGPNIHRVMIKEPLISCVNVSCNNFIWLEAGTCNVAVADDSCSSTITNPRFLGSFNNQDIFDQAGNTVFGNRAATLSLNTNQSIPNTTPTNVAFDTIVLNAYNWLTGVAPYSSIRVPPASGIKRCRVSFGGVFDNSSTTGRRTITATKNGSGASAAMPMPTATTPSTLAGQLAYLSATSPPLPCTGGDLFALSATQTSGGALNILGAGQTYLSVEAIE